ncbi:MAG: hypothetical protein AAGB46_01130 [Verrucomicrobiota bacterium]
MKRLTAIAVLTFFAWSLAFSQVGSLQLCLHGDGSAHIVAECSNDSAADSCGHSHDPSEVAHHHKHSHEHIPCADLELDVDELEEHQNAGFAQTLKAPILFETQIEAFTISLAEPRITAFEPRPQGPPLPSESRTHARIIQIRC